MPLVNNAEEADAAAVRAVRYPLHGMRSYGPMRSALRIGPVPAEADATVLCLAMIETPEGLENVKEICAVPGIDGVYIGPSDLCLAVGGKFPNDPDVAEEFNAALVAIREAAQAAGVIAAIHTASGEIASQRIAEGFTFVTVASDLTHLEIAAANHLPLRGGSSQFTPPTLSHFLQVNWVTLSQFAQVSSPQKVKEGGPKTCRKRERLGGS